MNAKKYTLTVTCPDKSGLIASITNCIASSKGNILNLAQHTATDISMFFCRVDFNYALYGTRMVDEGGCQQKRNQGKKGG